MNLTGLAGQIQSMTMFKYLIQRAFIIQPAEESILMTQRIVSMNCLSLRAVPNECITPIQQ